MCRGVISTWSYKSFSGEEIHHSDKEKKTPGDRIGHVGPSAPSTAWEASWCTVGRPVDPGHYYSLVNSSECNWAARGHSIHILHPPDSGQHAGSRKNLFSPTRSTGLLDLIPQWFKYDDGEITEAEMLRCVYVSYQFLCEKQCLCIIILVLVSNCVQTQSVINARKDEVLYNTPHPYTWYLHKLQSCFVKTVTTCSWTSSICHVFKFSVHYGTIKLQCFGGDYTGEVYDHALKM